MDIQAFWARANALIKERKTTQRAVSAQCGLTIRRVETLVSTNRLPDAFEAHLIAQALNTSVEFLVSGRDPAKPDTARVIQQAQELLDSLKKL